VIGRFHTDTTARADVAVVIVTYNSARDLPGLLASLRPETADLRLRVILVDNSSTDDTRAVAAAHDDVIAVAAGGNLGYAGGINVGMARVRAGEDVLVLNPDLRVTRGAVMRLHQAAHADGSIGVTAPRILDDDGTTTDSLHHEPTVLRAFADAALGPVWRRRPARLTEWIRDAGAYASPRDADWASGAALLVRADVAARVGAWDERFFLYSEETDYCRRVRDAGYRIRYVPDAVVHHSQGGSGSSPALDALLAVNRVRYARKHAPRAAGAVRAAAILGSALRAGRSAGHSAALRHLVRASTWSSLPAARRDRSDTPAQPGPS
jgi:GT2 family glycosyltransferase